jgi:hypothetical protein
MSLQVGSKAGKSVTVCKGFCKENACNGGNGNVAAADKVTFATLLSVITMSFVT